MLAFFWLTCSKRLLLYFAIQFLSLGTNLLKFMQAYKQNFVSDKFRLVCNAEYYLSKCNLYYPVLNVTLGLDLSHDESHGYFCALFLKKMRSLYRAWNLWKIKTLAVKLEFCLAYEFLYSSIRPTLRYCILAVKCNYLFFSFLWTE